MGPVPLVWNEVFARTVGKPLPLLEERVVEVPQVQVAEAIKEELVPNVQEVTKAIPKTVPNYIEKVIEINQGNVIHEEVPTREIDYGVVVPRAIEYASTPTTYVEPPTYVPPTRVISAPSSYVPAPTSYVRDITIPSTS